MRPITAVVADDLTMLREGITWRLSGEPDLDVVGTAATGREALRLVERHRPAVLVTEVHLPEMDALALLHELRRRRLETRVVILTLVCDRERVLELLEAGASGYVLKVNEMGQLADAIRGVVEGQIIVVPEVARVVLEAHYGRGATRGGISSKLTNREREILHWLSQGYSNSEIAAKLSISVKTVETHRANLYRKVGVRTVSELVITAVKQQLISV